MEIPYDLLIKYCKKQTSPEEKQLAEDWIAKDDNLSVFLDLKKEWKYMDDTPDVKPDKLLLWRKIEKETLLSKKKSKRITLLQTLVAACILGLAITSVYLFTYPREYSNPVGEELITTVTTQTNEKSKVQLADGTNIWLNANSQVLVGNQHSREVSVSGELFFDVTPADEKFIVNTGKVKIEVLGTSFNLKTSGIDDQVEISLKTGKVAVVNQETNKQLFVMDSSHHAVINTATLSHEVKKVNTSLSNSWTQQSLEMYNEPLENVILMLESWYGIEISYAGLDPNKRYSFYIQNESLTDFLNLFSSITPVNYELTGKKLYMEAIK